VNQHIIVKAGKKEAFREIFNMTKDSYQFFKVDKAL